MVEKETAMKRTIIISIIMLSGLSARLSAQVDSLTPLAVSTVGREEFGNSPQKQIMNALYGLVPGLYVSQGGSGAWPEDCSPELFVRGRGSFSGNSVLFLVDGVPREISSVDVGEVESVSVLKDAASLAIYGIRGADGAVLVKTRRGGRRGLHLEAEYSFGVMTPFRMPEMASPAAYASALNEARRNDGLSPWFSDADVASIASGTSSVIPSVDWKRLIFRETGFTNQARLTMDGATRHIKYFVYAGYDSSRGFFRNTGLVSGVDTQDSYDGLKLRTNLDIEVTPTTEVLVNLAARIQQKSGPPAGYDLETFYEAPSVGFPVKYNDIWARTAKFGNPVQELLGTGGTVTFGRMLSADLTIRQRLDSVLKGLSAKVRLSYDNSSSVNDNRSFQSSWYNFSPLYDASGNLYDYSLGLFGNDTEMAYSTGLVSQYMYMDVVAGLDWSRTFGLHSINASFAFNRDKKILTGANSSFVHHDYVLAADYNYGGRYVAAISGSYSGSSVMPSGDKFRFYPAAALGWIISGEDFMKGVSAVDFLKLRASYGLTGMDAFLSYDMDKQFNGEGKGYIFVSPTGMSGAAEGSLPSVGVQPELDTKADVSLVFRLFGGLTGEIGAFSNHRKYIRTKATGTISEVLGVGSSDTFNGQTSNRGFELSLGWRQETGDFRWHVSGNLSFARNRIDRIDEIYQPYGYLYEQGNSIGRFFGFVSDGFYHKEDFNADGSLVEGLPQNTFSSVRPGDVKYRDLNGDGKIDNYDRSYQLLSDLPELYGGLSLGFGWKGLGFSAVFSGAALCTAETSLSGIYQPLYAGDKNISSHYLKSYWSEDRPEGRYPRLTTLDNTGNYLPSDLWTENGAFLKLRELELYWELPERLAERAKMKGLRIYIKGYNVFSIDRIGIMDPESVNFGMPTARTFTVGAKVKF